MGYALVFRHGFLLESVGLLAGIAGAAVVTRWMEALLYNTARTDIAAWLAMIAVVVFSMTAACVVPARRAAAADPTAASRSE